jgi:excisionase family DNA binding protein
VNVLSQHEEDNMLSLTPVHASINQTCERYNVCRSYLYRLIGDGKIAAVKDGRRIKIIVESAETHFASLPKAKIKPQKRANDYRRADTEAGGA